MYRHLICVECVSEWIVKSLPRVCCERLPCFHSERTTKEKKATIKSFLAATVGHVQIANMQTNLFLHTCRGFRLPSLPLCLWLCVAPVSLWQSVTVTDRRVNNTGCLSWHVMKALVGFVCIQVESRFSPPACRLDWLRKFNSLKIHKYLWWTRSRWTLKMLRKVENAECFQHVEHMQRKLLWYVVRQILVQSVCVCLFSGR